MHDAEQVLNWTCSHTADSDGRGDACPLPPAIIFSLVDSGEIHSVDLAGRYQRQSQVLFNSNQLGNIIPAALAVDEESQYLYVGSVFANNEQLLRLPLDPIGTGDLFNIGEPETLVLRGIVADVTNRRLFGTDFTDTNYAYYYGTNLPKPSIVVLDIDDLADPIIDRIGSYWGAHGIAYDPAEDYVYYTTSGLEYVAENHIIRVKADGSAEEELYTVNYPYGIVLDPRNNKLYWVEKDYDEYTGFFNAGSIWEGSMDGSSLPQELVSDTTGPNAYPWLPQDIFLYEGRLYVSQYAVYEDSVLSASRIVAYNVSSPLDLPEVVWSSSVHAKIRGMQRKRIFRRLAVKSVSFMTSI